jgi:hypothetical protein
MFNYFPICRLREKENWLVIVYIQGVRNKYSCDCITSELSLLRLVIPAFAGKTSKGNAGFPLTRIRVKLKSLDFKAIPRLLRFC